MVIRERRLDRARRLASRALSAIGDEFRGARIAAGLTQLAVATSAGISGSELSRIEHGRAPHVSYETLVAIGSVLGLDVPLRAYLAGDAMRDTAQLVLLARFRSSLSASLRHRTEVPIGSAGDRRAWDLVVDGPGWSVGVEAETRLRDIQALCRRIALKARDGGVDRVILLLAGTRHNRHVVRLAADDLASLFPGRGRDALAALRAGKLPLANTVVLL
jgi:transcriptional regulator with XRE-family HTH domain